MSVKHFLVDSILETPPRAGDAVSPSIRSSLLSTLFDNVRPLFMAGVASTFVALIALARLHQAWAAIWLVLDVCILATRLLVIRSYVGRNHASAEHPGLWAAWYGPLCLVATLALGLGTMTCVMSADRELAALAIMVTAGILGGIASRNAALPRLAIAQISLGALPIGLGALLAPRSGTWILLPPLAAYLLAMVSIVCRHYDGLVALMAAEQRHAELAARFDAALAHMPHGLCTIDSTGKVVIANRRTAELFGATLETLRLNVPLPEFIGHVGLAQFGATLRQQLVDRCTAWLREGGRAFDLALRDGRQLEMTRNPVPDGSAVIIIEDVTERRHNEAKVLHLARHDPLTGLANRRYFQDQLQRMLAHERHEGTVPALLYLDLDGFKAINDRLGHGAGDEVLRMVAARLKQTLRHDELAARLGGDEFAIVVSH
ncbi:MAG TPA: diguanylate cyclase, partial [Paraburkholderia sp.]|uniref:diguanylate cyclase domain-containing protein n=1 Tax=Paraburkholderia sp. TaxID=1926495 RepID=UPI002B480CDF